MDHITNLTSQLCTFIPLDTFVNGTSQITDEINELVYDLFGDSTPYVMAGAFSAIAFTVGVGVFYKMWPAPATVDSNLTPPPSPIADPPELPENIKPGRSRTASAASASSAMLSGFTLPPAPGCGYRRARSDDPSLLATTSPLSGGSFAPSQTMHRRTQSDDLTMIGTRSPDACETAALSTYDGFTLGWSPDRADDVDAVDLIVLPGTDEDKKLRKAVLEVHNSMVKPVGAQYARFARHHLLFEQNGFVKLFNKAEREKIQEFAEALSNMDTQELWLCTKIRELQLPEKGNVEAERRYLVQAASIFAQPTFGAYLARVEKTTKFVETVREAMMRVDNAGKLRPWLDKQEANNAPWFIKAKEIHAEFQSKESIISKLAGVEVAAIFGQRLTRLIMSLNDVAEHLEGLPRMTNACQALKLTKAKVELTTTAMEMHQQLNIIDRIGSQRAGILLTSLDTAVLDDGKDIVRNVARDRASGAKVGTLKRKVAERTLAALLAQGELPEEEQRQALQHMTLTHEHRKQIVAMLAELPTDGGETEARSPSANSRRSGLLAQITSPRSRKKKRTGSGEVSSPRNGGGRGRGLFNRKKSKKGDSERG